MVCVAVILARIAWVTAAAAFSRRRCRPRTDGTPGPRDAVALSPRAAAVVGWCGMRGTVTLAAALALPSGDHGGASFPYRDLILVAAFGVVLGTLVLQGLTLRPLLLWLRLEDDGSVDREVRLARVETLRAAVEAVPEETQAEIAGLVRHSYELQLRRAEQESAGDAAHGNDAACRDSAAGELAGMSATAATATGPDTDATVLRAVTEAQRRCLMALRSDGTIGDAAFQRVEEELDWVELGWAQLLGPAQRGDGKK